MLLYYTLEFATDSKIKQIAEMLERETGFVSPDAGDVKARAATASLRTQDQVSIQIVYEDFGLITDLQPEKFSLWLHLIKGEGYAGDAMVGSVPWPSCHVKHT